MSSPAQSHGGGHTPIPKVGTLLSVWIALLILTLVTTSVSYLDLGTFNVIVALLIALLKASLVAWIFMGVRFTTNLTKLFVVAGLVWLCILIALTFVDYGTRQWTYQPQAWSTDASGGGSAK